MTCTDQNGSSPYLPTRRYVRVYVWTKFTASVFHTHVILQSERRSLSQVPHQEHTLVWFIIGRVSCDGNTSFDPIIAFHMTDNAEGKENSRSKDSKFIFKFILALCARARTRLSSQAWRGILPCLRGTGERHFRLSPSQSYRITMERFTSRNNCWINIMARNV